MASGVMAADGSGFFWNIDGNVGRNSPNKPEDVEFVRFGYACMGPLGGQVPAELSQVIARMSPSGGYGADLQAVIDLHEKLRGGAQDGHVSRVPPATTVNTYDGKHAWIVLALNTAIRQSDPTTYPRLDRSPKSGPLISDRAKKMFNV